MRRDEPTISIQRFPDRPNSGHEIHKEQPQLAIHAIRQVVEADRNGRLALPNSQRAEYLSLMSLGVYAHH